MHNLRPAILEQGLVRGAAVDRAALREAAPASSARSALPRAVPELPAGVPLVAYRAAQEALTNITKHAQASRVQIDLSLAGGVLSLEISDNGRGLSQDDLAKTRSFGIRGLHERAGTVGGWVDLSQRPPGHDADPVGAAGPAEPADRAGARPQRLRSQPVGRHLSAPTR